jgi:hypothetical protein
MVKILSVDFDELILQQISRLSLMPDSAANPIRSEAATGTISVYLVWYVPALESYERLDEATLPYIDAAYLNSEDAKSSTDTESRLWQPTPSGWTCILPDPAFPDDPNAAGGTFNIEELLVNTQSKPFTTAADV